MTSPRTPHREHAMTKDGRWKVTFNLAAPFYRVRSGEPQRLRYAALNGTSSSARSHQPPEPESSSPGKRDSDPQGFKSMSSSGLGSSKLRRTPHVCRSRIECTSVSSGCSLALLPGSAEPGLRSESFASLAVQARPTRILGQYPSQSITTGLPSDSNASQPGNGCRCHRIAASR